MDLPNEVIYNIGTYLSPLDLITYHFALGWYESALTSIITLSPHDFATFLATVSIKKIVSVILQWFAVNSQQASKLWKHIRPETSILVLDLLLILVGPCTSDFAERAVNNGNLDTLEWCLEAGHMRIKSTNSHYHYVYGALEHAQREIFLFLLEQQRPADQYFDFMLLKAMQSKDSSFVFWFFDTFDPHRQPSDWVPLEAMNLLDLDALREIYRRWPQSFWIDCNGFYRSALNTLSVEKLDWLYDIYQKRPLPTRLLEDAVRLSDITFDILDWLIDKGLGVNTDYANRGWFNRLDVMYYCVVTKNVFIKNLRMPDQVFIKGADKDDNLVWLRWLLTQALCWEIHVPKQFKTTNIEHLELLKEAGFRFRQNHSWAYWCPLKSVACLDFLEREGCRFEQRISHRHYHEDEIPGLQWLSERGLFTDFYMVQQFQDALLRNSTRLAKWIYDQHQGAVFVGMDSTTKLQLAFSTSRLLEWNFQSSTAKWFMEMLVERGLLKGIEPKQIMNSAIKTGSIAACKAIYEWIVLAGHHIKQSQTARMLDLALRGNHHFEVVKWVCDTFCQDKMWNMSTFSSMHRSMFQTPSKQTSWNVYNTIYIEKRFPDLLPPLAERSNMQLRQKALDLIFSFT